MNALPNHNPQIRGLTLIILCSLLLALSPRPADAELRYSVAPPLQEYELTSGEERELTITVANQDNAGLEIMVRLMDIELDRHGTVLIREPGSTPYSLASMVTMDESFLTLGPGETRQVTIRLKMPHRFSEGRYGVVVFETVIEQKREREKGNGVAVGARLGTVIMARPAVMRKRRGRVEKFHIDETGKTFTMTVANAGGTDFTAKGEVLVMADNKKTIARLPLKGGTGTILPGGSREFTARWEERDTAGAARYRALARVRYPGGPVLQQEEFFVLK